MRIGNHLIYEWHLGAQHADQTEKHLFKFLCALRVKRFCTASDFCDFDRALDSVSLSHSHSLLFSLDLFPDFLPFSRCILTKWALPRSHNHSWISIILIKYSRQMRWISSVPRAESNRNGTGEPNKILNFHCSIENDNYDIFWVNTLSYRWNVICCCHRWHMFFFLPFIHSSGCTDQNENGVLACERIVLWRNYVERGRRCSCTSTYCNPVESCNRIGQFALTFAFYPLPAKQKRRVCVCAAECQTII